jgi:molybdate transport system permease protein
MEYSQAHWLSGGLLLFSFVTLLLVYSLNKRFKFGGSQ